MIICTLYYLNSFFIHNVFTLTLKSISTFSANTCDKDTKLSLSYMYINITSYITVASEWIENLTLFFGPFIRYPYWCKKKSDDKKASNCQFTHITLCSVFKHSFKKCYIFVNIKVNVRCLISEFKFRARIEFASFVLLRAFPAKARDRVTL